MRGNQNTGKLLAYTNLKIKSTIKYSVREIFQT